MHIDIAFSWIEGHYSIGCAKDIFNWLYIILWNLTIFNVLYIEVSDECTAKVNNNTIYV